MKTTLRYIVTWLVLFAFTLSGCATATFNWTEGIQQSAEYLRPNATRPLWQTPLDDMVIDSMIMLGGGRLLVSTATLGRDRTLKNKEFLVLDTASGTILWRIPKETAWKHTYTVPITDPVILIEDRSPEGISYKAVDIENKAVLWEKKIKDATSLTAYSGNYLIISSREDKEKSTLRAIDLEKGQQVWSRSVASGIEGPPSVLSVPGRDDILAYGANVALVSLKDGGDIWINKNVPVKADTALPRIYKGSVFLSGEKGNIYRLKLSDGSIQWKGEVQGDNVITILVSGSRLFVVGKTLRSGRVILTCLNSKSGKKLWAYDYIGSLNSTLYEDERALTFVAGKNLVKLDKTKGTPFVEMALPFERLEEDRLPERIVLTPKGIVVANESNIASFTLRRNNNIYWRSVESIREYSETRKLLRATKQVVQQGQGQIASAPEIPSLPPVSRTYLDSVTSYRKSVFQRTSSVLSSPRSSSLSRQMAHEERIGALQSEMGALKRQHKAESRQAEINFALTAANLAVTLYSAYMEARAKAIDVGALEQAKYQLRTASENYSKLFVDRYYVRPYRSMTKGTGISIVNIITGEQKDMIVSPLNYSLEFTGQSFFLDVENETLFVSGIGLDPALYRKTEIEELGLVNIDYLPSVMAFKVKLP